MASALLGEESQWAHLLQPIKDMAANWDINIAHELEEYLEELEHITFSFEGGPTLNFAEAALVIQGSACVYSRKVEYLHTLVLQALACVADKKTCEANARAAGAQDDPDDEFGEEEAFLNLDDVLEEGTGIDLDEGAAEAPAPALRVPASLLALEDGGAPRPDSEGTCHRIAACAMHRSGALLLEPRDGDLLDERLQRCAAAGSAAPSQAPGAEAGRGGAQAQPVAQAAEAAELAGDWDDGGCGDGGGFDDDGGWDGGGGEPPEDRAELPDAPAAAASGRAGRPNPNPDPAPAFYDPYAPLDPHALGGLPIRPFRKGRAPRKPRAPRAAADDAVCVPGAVPALPAAASALTFAEFEYVLRARAAVERCEQRAERRASANARRASALLEAEVGGSDLGLGLGFHGGMAPGGDGALASAFEAEDAGGGAGDWDDDCGGGYGDDYGGAPSDDDTPLPDAAADEGAGPDLAALAAAGSALPAWAAAGGQAMGHESPGGGAAAESASYEDLCRAHIEAFIAEAAAAEVQTELAARVSGWRARIAPALAAQDARGEFDIHAYGTDILGDLARLSLADTEAGAPGLACEPDLAREPDLAAAPEVPFGEVAAMPHKWQVSRLFSALLQLANNGNVALLRGARPGEPFRLRLLRLARPSLGGFRAPSCLQTQDPNAPVPAGPAKAAGPAAAEGAENRTESKAVKRRRGRK